VDQNGQELMPHVQTVNIRRVLKDRKDVNVASRIEIM
jgi:hypothetical protein